jgi:uncharacterized lipoprotein YmbA
MKTLPRRSVLVPVLLLAGACSSVTLPAEQTYRLMLPPPAGGERPLGGVLRVGEIALGADLAGDRLMVAESGVRVTAYRYHRWAGPLERLVADAVVTGLARAHCFRQVKAEASRGGEDYLLTGRVLEFHQAPVGAVWHGLATLDLQLSDLDGRLLFQREFQASTPLAGEGPDALAEALSRSVGSIVDQIVARCDEADLFERPLDAAPGR